MSVRRMIGAAGALGLLTTAAMFGATAIASAAEESDWVTLSASGSGDEEIPAGSGEEGTKVTGVFSLSESKGEMTYTVTITGNSEEIQASHIHKEEKGKNGDIVIELDAAAVQDGTSAKVEVDPAIIARILNNPEGYYINVHSESFTAATGVARGQLTADAEAPDVINTGTGGQAASSAPNAGLMAVGGVLVLAAAAGSTVALRRRSGTDNA